MAAAEDEPVKEQPDLEGWSNTEEILEGLREDGVEIELERYDADDATELLNRLEEWVVSERDVKRRLNQMENDKCRYCLIENKILGVEGYEDMDIMMTEPMEEYLEEHDVSDFQERDPTLGKSNWTERFDTKNIDYGEKVVGSFLGYCEDHAEYVFFRFEEEWYEDG